MLKFSEWDRLYYSVDESLGDSVKNWLSKTFGGKIGKVDSVISDLVFAENNFARDWEKIYTEIFSLRDEMESEEISPEEEKEIESKIREKNRDLEKIERIKIQKIRSLNNKALDIIGDNPRIAKYWNLEKAKAERDVAENLYNISRRFPDKKMEDILYSKYLKSYEELKKREKEEDEIVPDDEKIEDKGIEKEEFSGDVNIKSLIALDFSRFTKEIKKYENKDLQRIQRALVNQKNMGLNKLRGLRREKSKQMDAAKKGEKEKILQKYNPLIYEVGEFIDRTREKINYINEQLDN